MKRFSRLSIVLRSCVIGLVLVLATVLAPAGRALAAGAPIAIGAVTTTLASPPSVAVDSTGTAYVAWAVTNGSGDPDTIQYCALPAGATACSQTGTLTPAQATAVDSVTTLVNGSTVFIAADGYGGPFGTADHVIAWQSTDSGATFTAVDSGAALGSVSGTDTFALNGLLVPGGGIGYAYQSPTVPYFTNDPVTNPPACTTSCPSAQLQPTGATDPLGNLGGDFASQSGTSAGILGVYQRGFTSGPLSCPSGQDGLDFIYGSGNEATANDYNIAPGTADSAWQTGVTLADCDIYDPAVTGGASGFGVVETNRATSTLQYHKFDPATKAFDTAPATIWTSGTSLAKQTSVSQDATGGVYTTFVGASRVLLAYSSDGGSTWTGPASLDGDANGTVQDLQSAVGPSGQGFAVWSGGSGAGMITAQQFSAADATPPATTLTTTQTSGTITGASITVPAGTSGESDQATLSGPNAATATGSVTYGLYSSSTCAASSLVVPGGTQSVNAGSVSPSVAVAQQLPAGTYYWMATYTGDLSDAPSASPCGSEVLTVAAPQPQPKPTPQKSTAKAPSGSGPVTHTTGGATVTIYKIVVVTGRTPRSIPVGLKTRGTRTITIQLLSAPKHGRAKVLASRTVTVRKSKTTTKLYLKLSAKIRPGHYTLRVTVSGPHHRELGRVIRQRFTLS